MKRNHLKEMEKLNTSKIPDIIFVTLNKTEEVDFTVWSRIEDDEINDTDEVEDNE